MADRALRRLTALVALGLVASGCTHVVWFGRSPNRKHVASVLEQGFRQRVRFDLVDGPPVLGVGVEGLVLSDSGHVAYPARVEGGWRVFHDGEPSALFDGVGDVVLSPDGAHLAWAAQRGPRWHVVYDGKLSDAFDTVLPGSLTFGPGGRFAFAAVAEGKTHLVLDGQRGPPFDGVGLLRFSADGARVGYVARRAGAHVLLVDGEELGSFESVSELHVGPPDVVVARGGAGWRVRAGEASGPVFDGVAGLSVSGAHVAYAGRRGRAQFVVGDGVEHGPFLALKPALSWDAQGRLVFAGKRDDGWHVFHGERASGPWEDLEAPVVAAARAAFLGERDGQRVLVVDGVERARFEWGSSLALSPDGARTALLARRGAQAFLVVDGVERPFEVVVAGTVAFSRDGAHAGCVTGEPRARRLFLTRDDGRRSPVDLEEVVAALSHTPVEAQLLSPDVELLRRWVQAELER